MHQILGIWILSLHDALAQSSKLRNRAETGHAPARGDQGAVRTGAFLSSGVGVPASDCPILLCGYEVANSLLMQSDPSVLLHGPSFRLEFLARNGSSDRCYSSLFGRSGMEGDSGLAGDPF